VIGAAICIGFFEAKKRFGLCVLDYMVTCNHIHLLVKDTGANVIAESMQLVVTGRAGAANTQKTVMDNHSAL